MPIQGKFETEVTAYEELKDEYALGLKDLEGFSHAIINGFINANRVDICVNSAWVAWAKRTFFASARTNSYYL